MSMNAFIIYTFGPSDISNKGLCDKFNRVCVCARPQESREQALESQLVSARWSSLQGAVEEAEKIIQDSLAQIDDPAHISCTSSAGQSSCDRMLIVQLLFVKMFEDAFTPELPCRSLLLLSPQTT